MTHRKSKHFIFGVFYLFLFYFRCSVFTKCQLSVIWFHLDWIYNYEILLLLGCRRSHIFIWHTDHRLFYTHLTGSFAFACGVRKDSNLHLYRCLLDVQGPLSRRPLVALVFFFFCGFDKITWPKITQMRRGFLLAYSTRKLESSRWGWHGPESSLITVPGRSPHQSLHPLLYFVQKDPPPKGFLTFSNQLESNCLKLRAYEGHSYSKHSILHLALGLIAIPWCYSL